MSGGISAFGGEQRARDGLIFTVVDLVSGRIESFQRRGTTVGRKPTRIVVGVTDVLRSVAAELDQRGGDWRVRTISSPSSIFRDLRGDPQLLSYEANLLGKIGRLDLLERTVRTSDAARRMAVQRRNHSRREQL